MLNGVSWTLPLHPSAGVDAPQRPSPRPAPESGRDLSADSWSHSASGGPGGGGGGGIQAMPSSKANHRGPTYLLPPKPKPGPLNRLGPLAEVDVLSGFRVRGKHQGPQNEPGPSGRIRARMTNQGPAGRIRGHGTLEQIRAPLDIGRRAPQYESGPNGTDQGTAGRIRVP